MTWVKFSLLMVLSSLMGATPEEGIHVDGCGIDEGCGSCGGEHHIGENIGLGLEDRHVWGVQTGVMALWLQLVQSLLGVMGVVVHVCMIVGVR